MLHTTFHTPSDPLPGVNARHSATELSSAVDGKVSSQIVRPVTYFTPATDAALLDQLRRDAVRTGRVYDNLAGEHDEVITSALALRRAIQKCRVSRHACDQNPAHIAGLRADLAQHLNRAAGLNPPRRRALAEMQAAQSLYFREAVRQRAEAGLMARGVGHLIGRVA